MSLESKIIFIFISLLFSTIGKANELKLNPIQYANRAECAIESNLATQSVFLLLDGYDAGKLGYSVAVANDTDPVAMSSASMKDFRLSVTSLTQTIMQRLLSGKLPLLPTDVSQEKESLSNYRQAIAACGNKVYCEEMDQYLNRLWTNTSDWRKIDSFTGANFFPQSDQVEIGCYYLKRFSPLQGGVETSAVNKQTLTDLAAAIQDQEKYLTDCKDSSDKLNSRNSIIQFDIQTDEKIWANHGFDFWNSVRIYLSWAWRNAPEMKNRSGEFGDLFPSLALEESMLFLPNGCRSVVPPSCTNAYLSINDMRELAKKNGSSDFNAQIPTNPADELLQRGTRSVNNDFLGTESYPTASEWVANFRKNFVQSRGQMKMRFTNALRTLNLIFNSLSPERINELLVSPELQSQINIGLRDELYDLCTEYHLAADPNLDILHSDIQRIKDLESLEQANESSKHTISELYSKFSVLAAHIIPLCYSLEKNRFWDAPGYTVSKDGLMPWAREVLQMGNVSNTPQLNPAVFDRPLLSWDNQKLPGNENIICANAIDCSRKILKSIVDLYAISNYADAFMPTSALAASPQLFNPYSDLQTCKVYDPHFQARRAKKDLLADLANTALFGWNFLPLYASVDISPSTVTSFQELVKNGKLQYDPKVEKEKVQGSLIADFGPLLGAPCAISISGNGDPLKAYEMYAFTGISMNYCADGTTQTITADSEHSFTGNTTGLAACGVCYLNFETVAIAVGGTAASAAVGFNPIKLFIYVFHSIQHYIENISDPVNVPKKYTVNLAAVVEAYQKNREIPENCVQMLSDGLRCFDNECDARIAKYFEDTYGGKVLEMNSDIENRFEGSEATSVRLKSSLCEGKFHVSYYCHADHKNLEIFGAPEASTKACQDVLDTKQGAET